MVRPLTLLVLCLCLLAGASLAGCGSGGGSRHEHATLVWAVGDGATRGRAPHRVAALIERELPLRVLYLGDVYENGTPEEFERNFDGVYGDLVDRMWPTPGNHEWPNHRIGYDPYWQRVRGQPMPPWYEKKLAGWQVLSLNSEAPHDSGSPQLRWLKERLTGSSTCRIAFWHRPRFSAGTHGDQEDIEALWRAVRGRAALVINGHDHDLQRLEPVDGTTAFVTGGGGNERYTVDHDHRRLAWGDDRHDGALRIELRRDSANLSFVAADGRTLDRSTVDCRR